jgi:hypothetical protein
MFSPRYRSGPACALCAVIALGCLVGAADRARANGLELLPGGVRSAGRGGAVAARPEDPMAMSHNPAGLAFMPRDQFMINVDMAVHDMCVDLYGYYGWGIYDDEESSDFGDPLAVELDDDGDPIIGATYATTPLPEVCNTGRAVPLPHIAWAGHLTDTFTLAVGMVAPTLVTGLQYGGDDGTIQREVGLPTPTRYQIIRQRIEFGLAPSVAAAYRVLPQLSVGVNLQVAMLRAKNWTMINGTSGTQPSQDWLAEVDAHDYFVPALTVAAHARPLRGLDLMASFRWLDSFDGSGEAVFETNTFYDEDADSGSVPFANDPVSLEPITVAVPWTLTVGARYAGLLSDVDPDDSDGTWDPMGRELWDVEVDVAYNLASRASESSVGASEDVTVITRDAMGGGDRQTVTREDLEGLSSDRHFKNSIAARLGGSFSIMPRKVALHGGAFYESRALDPAYAHVESFAFQRLGLGLGVMVRLGDFDVMAAYSHIFQETIEVAPPPHQEAENFDPDDPTTGFDQRVGGTFEADGTRTGGRVLPDPDAPDPEDADAVARAQQSSAAPMPARPERVINAGKYTAAFDVISVGATYHF